MAQPHVSVIQHQTSANQDTVQAAVEAILDKSGEYPKIKDEIKNFQDLYNKIRDIFQEELDEYVTVAVLDAVLEQIADYIETTWKPTITVVISVFGNKVEYDLGLKTIIDELKKLWSLLKEHGIEDTEFIKNVEQFFSDFINRVEKGWFLWLLKLIFYVLKSLPDSAKNFKATYQVGLKINDNLQFTIGLTIGS
jgi:sugar-specific transcriptional regulator TrmB